MPGVIIKITYCYSYPLIFGTRHLDSWTSLVKTQTCLIPSSFPFHTVSCENVGWVPYSHPGCGYWWVSQTEKLWPVVRFGTLSSSHILPWCVHMVSHVWLCGPWPVAHQAPLSMQHSLQARILEWVAISSSRGSSQPRDQTCISCVSCITGRFFNTWSSSSIASAAVYWLISQSASPSHFAFQTPNSPFFFDTPHGRLLVPQPGGIHPTSTSCIGRQSLTTEPPGKSPNSFVQNCLLCTSTWMCKKHLISNMCKTQFLILSPTLKHPSQFFL